MQITVSQIKDIKTAFAALKPQKITLDGNHPMTVKEAVLALAPTLERMKKRGFELEELVTKLHEKGVPVKAQTLAKYLNEFRRAKGKKIEGKTDTSLLSMPVRLEGSPTGTASPPSVGPRRHCKRPRPRYNRTSLPQPSGDGLMLYRTRHWKIYSTEHRPAPQTYKRPSDIPGPPP